ncbi:MAG: carboxypeptidase-like regulatory domain-containing protein [Ignavibacteria bacterium]|jgi:hypothetical protein|nr:carboxypeptidase-like regulatory domain-containing protein [Ignavibacteria bacterium]
MFTMLLLLSASSAYASIYGVLSGKVVDDDGKGVIGATLRVEGTSKGTNIKARDGSFTLSNITAGNYVVVVRSVGKTEQKINVRISADQTTEITVRLKDDAVMMETVVVTANTEKAKAVDSKTVGAISTLSNEELNRATGSNLAAVVGMSAGVSSGSDGYAIRGSRPSETQIRLDGLNMGNQFSGGFGASGSTYFPMVSSYATEEVQVITGNFSAQYGDAQGGIVNSVMKTGRTNGYEGFIGFRSDLPFLAGNQSNNVELLHENGQYKVVDGSGDGLSYLQAGRMDIDVGIGGPIPINDRTTFYFTYSQVIVPHGSGYDFKDPFGASLIRSAVEGTQMKNFEGRIAIGLTNDIKLVLGGKYGLTNSQSTSFRYAYDIGTPYINQQTGEIDPINGVPTPNGVTQEVGKAQAMNQFVENAFARLNHTLTDNSYYEITLAWGANNSESSRKVVGSDLNFFTGYELLEPVDNWIVDASTWVPSAVVGGRNVGDKMVDWASPTSSIRLSQDGYCTSTFNGVNPFTGYYEGEAYSNGTNNPWGRYGLYASGGSPALEFEYANFLQASGDYNLFGVSTGDFKHTVKAGFEASYYTMNRHVNQNPYSGSPVYDIYTDKWGGNIYAENEETYSKTSEPMTQYKVGIYVQDQITYKGIVFNPGLRLDIMDPMNSYRVLSEEHPQFIPISSTEAGVFKDATVKYQISPRININYPLTENSFISMSYGQFFQSAPANYLYYYYNTETMHSGLMVGDPNMESQQTNQYQVAYQNQITEDIAISASVYYKDIYNQLGVKQVMTAPESYYQYAVSEYGSSKGIELKVDKYLSNYFGLSLNYALAYLTVTSTEETSNTNVLLDPYTQKLTFPLAAFFSSNDVRHQLKGSLFFVMGKDEGPTLWGWKPLQNAFVQFEPSWSSGAPYTKVSMDGSMYISDRNTYRYPSNWNVDMRVSKRFYLADWFGESMGKTANVEFYVNVRNVFNRRQPVYVYSNTGDPLDNGQGLNYTMLGNFSATPWYKDATYANPASYTNEQYDIYGNRLYNENSDLDHNGILTQQEKYDAYKKYYEEITIQQRSYYSTPITVKAGLIITF